MFTIEADCISKSFPSTTPGKENLAVVDKFTLRLIEGELVTIFGPNGCGKTTILNLLAGTIKPDTGRVLWNTGGSQSRQVGYVFQNYADTLLPWRTVRSNVSFPLEVRRLCWSEVSQKVAERIEQFGLTEHADKYIYELSGGLKQLVAIARSTVYDPHLLLLDEPFSALDYSVSRNLWTRFHRFWSDSKLTTVFVSHNIDEALFLGDRVCVMSSRPARIVREIRLPFGNERSLDLLGSRKFFAVRAEVLEEFEKGRSL